MTREIQATARRAWLAGSECWGATWTPQYAAVAPGRVEILGNHVDYNGGPVLAAAIDRAVIALVDESNPARNYIEVLFTDTDFSDFVTIESGSLADWRNTGSEPLPGDYARGVVATAMSHGQGQSGQRIAVASSVPIGMGLSSSAALCVSLSLVIHDPTPAGIDLALRAQEAEHRAGTPCGMMDQSASVHGNVIRFDGATLNSDRLNPDLGDFVLVAVNSGVKRSLGTSSYPERVRECNEALKLLRARIDPDITSLAALNPDQFEALLKLRSDQLPDVLKKRVRHVVAEVERVNLGLAALSLSDWPRFGELMNESGDSSSNDYEISHPRVEALVAEMRHVEGVAGARMMGGGEGGSALGLIRSDAVTELRRALSRGYLHQYGLDDGADCVHQLEFASGAGLFEFSDTNLSG